MRRRWAVLSLGTCSALLCAAWACSSSPDHPPVLPDVPQKDGGNKADVGVPSSCKAEDGGCNQLETCGAKVYVVQVAATAPAPAGGTAVDGTYEMIDYKVFTGAGGKTGNNGAWFRQTMSFTTSSDDAGLQADSAQSDAGPTQEMAWLEVSESNAESLGSATGHASFQVQAPYTSVITFACPGGFPYVSPYTATADRLVLFADSADGKAAITYAKK